MKRFVSVAAITLGTLGLGTACSDSSSEEGSAEEAVADENTSDTSGEGSGQPANDDTPAGSGEGSGEPANDNTPSAPDEGMDGHTDPDSHGTDGDHDMPGMMDGEEDKACGPQAPRDISSNAGSNTVPVPQGETETLCNVHFHDPFEHAGFDPAPEVTGETGEPVCKTVDIGTKVEFHWVYTNCPENDPPIKGLANCVCEREDLVLRVFAQTYVVSDEGEKPEQPEESLVAYAGSTTGTKYDNMTCSPAKVNWQVSKETLAVSKEELGKWCEENPWPDEDHPHGSRVLVTDEKDLSQID